jgi:hypothetical protein
MRYLHNPELPFAENQQRAHELHAREGQPLPVLDDTGHVHSWIYPDGAQVYNDGSGIREPAPEPPACAGRCSHEADSFRETERLVKLYQRLLAERSQVKDTTGSK